MKYRPNRGKGMRRGYQARLVSLSKTLRQGEAVELLAKTGHEWEEAVTYLRWSGISQWRKNNTPEYFRKDWDRGKKAAGVS